MLKTSLSRTKQAFMLLSLLVWQDMHFLELLSHSDEQRQAVFNPTRALLSEQIYFVDGALLTHITAETFSILTV